jgi:hypothetical protein
MRFFRCRKPRYTRLEDALWALARRELETGEVRVAVWETALRLAHGDGRRAVGTYIRLRVRALLLGEDTHERSPESEHDDG